MQSHGRLQKPALTKKGCSIASADVILFDGWTFSIFDSKSNTWSSFFKLRSGMEDCSALAAHPVCFSCSIPSRCFSHCSPRLLSPCVSHY
jgi:hypothetical protein